MTNSKWGFDDDVVSFVFGGITIEDGDKLHSCNLNTTDCMFQYVEVMNTKMVDATNDEERLGIVVHTFMSAMTDLIFKNEELETEIKSLRKLLENHKHSMVEAILPTT